MSTRCPAGVTRWPWRFTMKRPSRVYWVVTLPVAGSTCSRAKKLLRSVRGGIEGAVGLLDRARGEAGALLAGEDAPAEAFEQVVGRAEGGGVFDGLGGPGAEHGQVGLKADGLEVGEVVGEDVLAVGVGEEAGGGEVEAVVHGIAFLHAGGVHVDGARRPQAAGLRVGAAAAWWRCCAAARVARRRMPTRRSPAGPAARRASSSQLICVSGAGCITRPLRNGRAGPGAGVDAVERSGTAQDHGGPRRGCAVEDVANRLENARGGAASFRRGLREDGLARVKQRGEAVGEGRRGFGVVEAVAHSDEEAGPSRGSR